MISVVIPSYNRASTIKRSIDSVLNQTYVDLELIIVDDNSTDDTQKIVESINDSRVRYIRHEKNLGANAARNTGIINARGEIIAFQDSDDEWLNNKLEIQLKELIDNDADIVSCSINKYINNKKKIIPNRLINSEKIKQDILYGNFISGQTIMGKKECFLLEKFDTELPRLQEWELIIRLSEKYKIYFVNKPLVNVFVQNDSISVNPEKAIIALKYIIKKHHMKFSNNKKSMAILYRMLGNYSMEANIYNQNYFAMAIKYDRLNIKLYIKFIICFFRGWKRKKCNNK